MHRGSCLCGGVRYEIAGAIGAIVMCHCGQCRKAQGTAFATNCQVNASDFQIVAGLELLRTYASSSDKERAFCSVCGSPIFSKRADTPATLRIRVGTLDSPVNARPQAHIFAASKADWFEIADSIPQYPRREPGRSSP